MQPHKSWSKRSRGMSKMGTDKAPVKENLKLCRFHPKRDIFWVSVTISEIWRYVSASVTGCWGFCEWVKMAHCHFKFDSNKGDLSPHILQTIYFSNINKNKASDGETPVELSSLEPQYGTEPLLIIELLLASWDIPNYFVEFDHWRKYHIVQVEIWGQPHLQNWMHYVGVGCYYVVVVSTVHMCRPEWVHFLSPGLSKPLVSKKGPSFMRLY